MERLHVHFSSGLPSDGEVISGMTYHYKHTINEFILPETSSGTKAVVLVKSVLNVLE